MIEKSILPICGACFSELLDGEELVKGNNILSLLEGGFYNCPSCGERYTKSINNLCSICGYSFILDKPEFQFDKDTDYGTFLSIISQKGTNLCSNPDCPSYTLTTNFMINKDGNKCYPETIMYNYQPIAIIIDNEIEINNIFSEKYQNKYMKDFLLKVYRNLKTLQG